MSESVKETKVARGGKIIVSTSPIRDGSEGVGKKMPKMGGSNDDLSHSITKDNRVPAK